MSITFMIISVYKIFYNKIGSNNMTRAIRLLRLLLNSL